MTDQTKLMQTVEEFARDAGLCTSRIRQLLLKNEIPGARKFGRDWMIPTGAVWDRRSVGRPRGETGTTGKARGAPQPY